jgi:hypothetical protein
MPDKKTAPATRKRTRARAAKPRTVARVTVYELDDPDFAGRFGGAWQAQKGRVKSDVRSTRERALEDLKQKLAAR